MYKESFIEEGIVTKVSNDELEITLIETSNCESCITKDLCKGEKSKTLVLRNNYNISVGDNVLIEVKGKTIFQIVSLLYGIPSLILILVFLIIYNIIQINKELISSSVAFFTIGIYYLIIYLHLRKFNNKTKINVIKKT